jgi:hypothetical protein
VVVAEEDNEHIQDYTLDRKEHPSSDQSSHVTPKADTTIPPSASATYSTASAAGQTALESSEPAERGHTAKTDS